MFAEKEICLSINSRTKFEKHFKVKLYGLMAHGRFDNPVVAALAGVKDFFGKQDLAYRLTDQDRADDLTVVITGANSGLGFGLAVDFASRGARVIMAGRSDIPKAGEEVKRLSGSSSVEMRFVDLSKINTIHSFCEGLVKDGVTIDRLVLNAGVALPGSRKTESGLEEMFLVNYLSSVILSSRLLTEGVIPNHTYHGDPPGRMAQMVIISSDSHQGASAIDFEQFGKYEEYGVKKGINYYSYYKLVLNTFATEMSRRLMLVDGKPDVSVNVICPGPVNSNIVKEAPWMLRTVLKGIFSLVFRSPRVAAKPVVYMCLSKDFEGSTNEYLHMFNPKRMDEKVYLNDDGKKLWLESNRVWMEHDPQAEEYILN